MGSFVSVAASGRRFQGGKLALKYWEEDLYGTVEELYDKLSIEKSFGFEIFKAFVSIETNDSGYVTSKQCQQYFGGFNSHSTRYTERLFYHVNNVSSSGNNVYSSSSGAEEDGGLSFEDFSIQIWNYCSFSISHLSQQIFEIYDISQSNELQRPDVESIFRMMHDRDEHEESCIEQFDFDSRGFISKRNFIQHCCKIRYLIQPAISFQRYYILILLLLLYSYIL